MQVLLCHFICGDNIVMIGLSREVLLKCHRCFVYNGPKQPSRTQREQACLHRFLQDQNDLSTLDCSQQIHLVNFSSPPPPHLLSDMNATVC